MTTFDLVTDSNGERNLAMLYPRLSYLQLHRSEDYNDIGHKKLRFYVPNTEANLTNFIVPSFAVTDVYTGAETTLAISVDIENANTINQIVALTVLKEAFADYPIGRRYRFSFGVGDTDSDNTIIVSSGTLEINAY